MKVIDAEGAVLGRLASRVAKMLLEGEKIIIVNAEKTIISGRPEMVLERFKEKRERGSPKKGPFYPRYPDKIIRRVVRGMLPYKKYKGKNAFKNLKVFIGCPENYKNKIQAKELVKTADELNCKFVTLGEICKKLGAKW